jgi:hypothetical protein
MGTDPIFFALAKFRHPDPWEPLMGVLRQLWVASKQGMRTGGELWYTLRLSFSQGRDL